MWKLRQHLLTHAAAVPRRRSSQQAATGDHQYADTSRHQQQPSLGGDRKKDDHPYATPPTSVTAMEVDEEARSNVSRDHSYLGCSPVKPQPTASYWNFLTQETIDFLAG